MNLCTLKMPSYTYAVKSEKLLSTRGFRCEIKREDSPSGRGCGFYLSINGDCRKAADILDDYAVPYSAFNHGGD